MCNDDLIRIKGYSDYERKEPLRVGEKVVFGVVRDFLPTEVTKRVEKAGKTNPYLECNVGVTLLDCKYPTHTKFEVQNIAYNLDEDTKVVVIIGAKKPEGEWSYNEFTITLTR